MAESSTAGRSPRGLPGIMVSPDDDADDANVASQLARAVLAEVNVMRRDPSAYAEEMKSLHECYAGDRLCYPYSNLEVDTQEGAMSLEDCLNDLRSAAPLPLIMMSQAISKSCEAHVADLQDSGDCSHVGTDGSTPEIRLARVGEHREQCGENIVFGLRSSKEMVYHMLIDDGAPERGHRANLLNPDFRFGGVGFGSHPGAQTSLVLLLADHFKARAATRTTRMKNISEELLGRPVEVKTGQPGAAHHTVQRHWDDLMQEVKPDHLRVPAHLHSIVVAHEKPKVYRSEQRPTPPLPLGSLKPQPSIDPALIRAFVHRLDVDHDSMLEEDEVLLLCHQKQLGMSPEDIAQMFDEVLLKRKHAEARARGLKWGEVFSAVQCQKCYVPTVDINLEIEGGISYGVSVETEEMLSQIESIYRNYRDRCPGLPSPPSRDKFLGRNSTGTKPVLELTAFLQALVDGKIVQQNGAEECEKEEGEGGGGGGTLLQHEEQVRAFLGFPTAKLVKAACLGRRQLWSFRSRPFREQWLTIIHAAGLEPLIPLPELVAPKTLGSIMDEHVADSLQRNQGFAKPTSSSAQEAKASQGMTTTGFSQRVKVTNPVPKVTVRPPVSLEETDDVRATNTDKNAGQTKAIPHWEERRVYTETLVNEACSKYKPDDISYLLEKDDDKTRAPPSPGVLSFTFEARRRHQQVLSNYVRSSEERRFLATEKRSLSAGAAATLKGRRTGAHSTTAPAGTRGHFHNSTAIMAPESEHMWPRAVDVRLDGQHIDATLAPELRPNPKYSTMTKEEKSKQFSCYFSKEAHKCSDLKLQVASDQAKDLKLYAAQDYEFRSDLPQRHGKYGRRAFDPQVREKPLTNSHGVSEIEAKPVEQFVRQQEKISEFLDRALPNGQSSHFKTYLPKSEMAEKYEEMSTRQRMNFVMDGGQKRDQLGYFQSRHSDHTDMNLYTRPLGASQMDRKLPLA